MDEHGQHLYDDIGPYNEGSNLTFICEVDGGMKLSNSLNFLPSINGFNLQVQEITYII